MKTLPLRSVEEITRNRINRIQEDRNPDSISFLSVYQPDNPRSLSQSVSHLICLYTSTFTYLVLSPSCASLHIGRRSPSIPLCPLPDRLSLSTSYPCLYTVPRSLRLSVCLPVSVSHLIYLYVCLPAWLSLSRSLYICSAVQISC